MENRCPYEICQSYKVKLHVGIWLEKFVLETFSVIVQNIPLPDDKRYLLLGEREIDLVELGFEVPTAEAILHMKELREQVIKAEQRTVLLKQLAALDALPTDAYEQTDFFDRY